MGSSDFDLLAASLRADSGDVKAFVEALAAKLTETFPDHVQIERRGAFGRRKRVRRISAILGDEQFELDHDRGHVVCRRRNIVRGIALSNEELDVDAWIEALSAALVREAESTERGRQALAQLLE